MKRVLVNTWVYFLFGVFFGGTVTTWIAPRMITWWYTPPTGDAMFNCAPAVEWALGRLQVCQLWGSLAFGILFLVVYLTVQLSRRNNQRTNTSPENR